MKNNLEILETNNKLIVPLDLVDGTRWFYNNETNLMWYQIEAQGTKDYSQFEGQKKYYLDWIALYGEFSDSPYMSMKKGEYERESDGTEEDSIRIASELITVAKSYGKYLKDIAKYGSSKGLATLLLNYADVLADTLRKKIENTGNGLRRPDLPADIISKIEKTIDRVITTQNIQDCKGLLSRLSGYMVANQVFLEGNNRANYFLLIMLGEVFNISIPEPDKALKREKIGFSETNITKQFMKMFNIPEEAKFLNKNYWKNYQ